MNLGNFKQIDWQKIYAGLFDFSILALVFGTPLYLSILFKTNNIFDLGKLFWFQIWLFLALFFFLLKILVLAYKKETLYLPGFLKKPIIYLPSLFLLVFLAISLFWSQNPNQSFFGSYYRNDGIVNCFGYFISAILVSFYLTCNGPKNISGRLRIFLTTITLSASLASFYAVCQYFGFDFLIWQEPAVLTHRAASTLLQPNFLASFLLLTSPFAFLLAFLSNKNILRFSFFALGFLQLLALAFSGSRGAWVSILVSFVIFLCLLIVKKAKVKKNFYLVAVVLLILGLVCFGLSKNDRFRQVTNFSEGSSAYRIEIYQAAISQIKKAPVLGYGAESQRERLVYEYKSDWAVFDSAFLLPDRAHNLFLDLTLCFGIFGLVIWLAWYFSIFFHLSKVAKKIENYPTALTVGFAIFSYLFSLLFSFSVATTSIYFFLIFGVILALAEPVAERKLSFNFPKYFAVIAALVISVLLIIYSFKIIIADYYFYYFNQSWEAQEYSSAFRIRENIIKLGIADFDYRKMMLVKMASIQNNYQNKDLTEKILQVINQDKIFFDSHLVFEIESLMEFEAFAGNFEKANLYREELLRAAPFWPRAYYYSGLVQARFGKFNEARSSYGKSTSLLPDQDDHRLNEQHKGDILLIKSDVFFAIANTYEIEKEWLKASNYYGLSYLNNPKNLENLYKIAFCFDKLGETDRADSIRKMLKDILNK
ncbi:MAG: O-antigen ligase family protein [Patescibacteria group bacterium]